MGNAARRARCAGLRNSLGAFRVHLGREVALWPRVRPRSPSLWNQPGEAVSSWADTHPGGSSVAQNARRSSGWEDGRTAPVRRPAPKNALRRARLAGRKSAAALRGNPATSLLQRLTSSQLRRDFPLARPKQTTAENNPHYRLWCDFAPGTAWRALVICTYRTVDVPKSDVRAGRLLLL